MMVSNRRTVVELFALWERVCPQVCHVLPFKAMHVEFIESIPHARALKDSKLLAFSTFSANH